jgi:hypothetical protein
MADIDLDAMAAELERGPGTACTVCVFIEDQPDPAQWDALLAGRRSSTAVLGVLQRFGYSCKTNEPVKRHRQTGHRR